MHFFHINDKERVKTLVQRKVETKYNEAYLIRVYYNETHLLFIYMLLTFQIAVWRCSDERHLKAHVHVGLCVM